MEKIFGYSNLVEQLGDWINEPKIKKFVEDIEFKKFCEQLLEKYSVENIYPPKEMIFNAFKLTPLSKVKIVILGQDPYHQPNQAMGLAFSVDKKCKTPPSLKTIYKAIINGYPETKMPEHGDISHWCEQGVFLLNTLLTVEEDIPMSHKNLGNGMWIKFTDLIIKTICEKHENVVFLLWGNEAKKKSKFISGKQKIMETVHPSPLASPATFIEANHFKLCNDYLESIGKTSIKWL